MESIDTLIEAAYLLPMHDQQTVLSDHALAIHQGKILAIDTASKLKERFQAKQHIKRPHHALLPGFVNAHTHVPMNLLRGLADDFPLMTWLSEHIWPAEMKFMNPDFIRDGSLLAMAEMIRSGTTCFNDMYFFHDAIIEASLESGMRANVGLFVIEFPSPWANDAKDYLKKAEATLKRHPQNDHLGFTLAPHAIYSVKDETLRECKALADQYGLRLHMHVQETSQEVSDSLAATGHRPLRRLYDLGLLDDRFMAVHMTQIDDEDRQLLKQTGAHIIHCPQSNMKLASGICPITQLHADGINIAIGTDGVASNNDLNMIEEMRTANLLAKVASGDATSIPASYSLEMSTLGGARAIGKEKIIGSLAVGKAADFITVDLDQFELLPLYHPQSQLVYAANRENIQDVFVAGQALMENRELKTLDLEKAKATAKKWAKSIAAT